MKLRGCVSYVLEIASDPDPLPWAKENSKKFLSPGLRIGGYSEFQSLRFGGGLVVVRIVLSEINPWSNKNMV